MEKENLIGRQFGKLTVIKPVLRSSWVCRCDCGNYITVCTAYLTSEHTRSCGCLYRKATAKALAEKKKNSEEICKKFVRSLVTNPKPTKRNKTSTRRGVCFNKIEGKYMAYINVKGKRLYLGMYKKESDAIAARKEAEVMYFGSKA